GWDEPSREILGATSGTRFVEDSSTELLTDLTTRDGTIVNRVVLRNTASATRLGVKGRFVHEVFDGSHLVARLRSAPVDVVLSPGGTVSGTFSYLLPTGDYTIQTAFESSK
ncbi:MAG: hypothetical protein M3273_00170, partial [Actinomycetota bacterium]|nr:hypothetical protein [Actinomycetota bacterium]